VSLPAANARELQPVTGRSHRTNHHDAAATGGRQILFAIVDGSAGAAKHLL
jgi:hypothetical protein